MLKICYPCWLRYCSQRLYSFCSFRFGLIISILKWLRFYFLACVTLLQCSGKVFWWRLPSLICKIIVVIPWVAVVVIVILIISIAVIIVTVFVTGAMSGLTRERGINKVMVVMVTPVVYWVWSASVVVVYESSWEFVWFVMSLCALLSAIGFIESSLCISSEIIDFCRWYLRFCSLQC